MGKFIIGLILGVAIAGGLAFYLSYAPNQIVNKVTNSGISTNVGNDNSTPIVLVPGTKLQASIGATIDNNSQKSSDVDTKSYDFYDILPGNKSSASGVTNNTFVSGDVFVIQAGVFTDQDAANDMKARLALLGIDSQIKAQQQEGKVINQVIVGPFTANEDAGEVLDQLKSENIQGVIIKVDK